MPYALTSLAYAPWLPRPPFDGGCQKCGRGLLFMTHAVRNAALVESPPGPTPLIPKQKYPNWLPACIYIKSNDQGPVQGVWPGCGQGV